MGEYSLKRKILIFVLAFSIINIQNIQLLHRVEYNQKISSNILPKSSDNDEINLNDLNPLDLKVQNNKLYILDKSQGIIIFDITKENNFHYLGNIEDINNPIAFRIRGNYIYLLEQSCFKILNLSDHSSYNLVSSLELGSHLKDFNLFGNYAFILGNDSSNSDLITLDVSVVSNPCVVKSYNLSYSPKKIIQSGRDLIIISENDILYSYYLFNFPNFTLNTQINLSGSYHSSSFYGGNLVLGIGLKIVIYEINTGAFILLNNSLSLRSHALDIEIAGNYGFLRQNESLKCISLKDVHNPSVVGSFEPNGACISMQISSNFLYFLDDTPGINALMISSPFIPPKKITEIDKNILKPQRIRIKGNLMVIVGKKGLYSLDMQNCEINNFKLLDNVVWSGDVNNLAIDGQLAYIIFTNGSLFVYNISNPHNINKISSFYDYRLSLSSELKIDGFLAYVSAQNYGVLSLNLTLLNSIKIMDQFNITIQNANDLEIVGDCCYVSDFEYGLRIVNIADPSNLILKKSYEFPSNVYDMELFGSMAVIANGKAGISLLNISDISKISVISKFQQNDLNFIDVDSFGNFFFALDKNDGNLMGDIQSIDYRFYSFNIYQFDDPSKIGYCSFFESVEDMEIKDDQAFVLKSSGKFHCIKVQQIGEDDYDKDGLIFLEEVWHLNTDPDRYNFLEGTSYITISVILGVFGTSLIVLSYRYYKKKAKKNPLNR